MSVRPKKKCCMDKPRCQRCPIRLLADGRLSPEDARTIFAEGPQQEGPEEGRNSKKTPLTKVA